MKHSPTTFTADTLIVYSNELAATDLDLKGIINQFGYPPFWSREPSFETLVHIILEQQVSLASAKAALEKLRERILQITPANLLLLTDEELKSCYFSRQKMVYTRDLAQRILSGSLVLDALAGMSDDAVGEALLQVKGIGQWTVEVYLMMVLNRCNLFPLGDVALVNILKTVKRLPPGTGKVDMLTIVNTWQPYRTIAAYLLWHAYLQKRALASLQKTKIIELKNK